MDIDLPSLNEHVRILAYRCDDPTSTDQLVAIDVAVCVCVVTTSQAIPDIPNCTNGYFECDPNAPDVEGVEFIQLRDYSTYIPFWRGKAAGVTGR